VWLPTTVASTGAPTGQWVNSNLLTQLTVSQDPDTSLWYPSVSSGGPLFGLGYSTQAEAEAALAVLLDILGTYTP
jgi:hypothetical protein